MERDSNLKARGGEQGSNGSNLKGWRRRRDSNPRYAFGAYNGLANRRLQPLGHVSGTASAYRIYNPRSNLYRPDQFLGTRTPGGGGGRICRACRIKYATHELKRAPADYQ